LYGGLRYTPSGAKQPEPTTTSSSSAAGVRDRAVDDAIFILYLFIVASA
jgi:hypothetical protein